MLALFTLAVFLGARQGALAQFPSTAGNDLTPSMGQFSIVVAKNFQPMMVGYPSYNSSTHILVSPVLARQQHHHRPQRTAARWRRQ